MKKTKSNSHFGGNADAKAIVGTKKTVRRKRKDDIQEAYDIGYARGWDDTYTIPKRVGANKVASQAYKEGARNHQRSDKYISKYKRRG